MKDDIISYLITFAVVIVGLGAAGLILQIASPNTAKNLGGNEAKYAPFQQSILNQ